MRTLKKIGAWIERNEHHLGVVVFLGGFVLDNLAFTQIDLPLVNALFIGYLVVAAIGIFLAHFLLTRRPDLIKKGRKSFPALLTLAAQFCLGGLLSGCVIFYFKSAVLSASWPFIILLVGVFIANELLHSYREELAFQVSLFFLTLYAYAIFEVPIATGQMGPLVFLLSGFASLLIGILFCVLLFFVGRGRLMAGWKVIATAFIAIFAVVNLSYFTGVLPPLPLALKDSAIAHDLTRAGGDYDLSVESASGNPFSTPVIHHVAGTPLYAFSAVFAPITITTPIVHEWQYDDPQKGWVTTERVSFPIAGGRDGGYRGYSEVLAVTPGKWRVSIETYSGQIIGRIRFDVVSIASEPALTTVVK